MSVTENQPETPHSALKAILKPSPLTLGQYALLELIDSALLKGGRQKMSAVAPGVYLLSMPTDEALKHLDTLQADTLAWLDSQTPDNWRERLDRAAESINEFFALLPQPEAGAKKNDTRTGS